METSYARNGRYINHEARIDGKIVIITGANSGLGQESAVQLAQRGGKIYLACRNEEKGITAVKDVKVKSGSENVHFMQLDLQSQEDIREFSRKFHEAESKLDILINNAGLMGSKGELTKDGINMSMGINHIGHFLLTNLLLDLLKSSTPSRIVTVSSGIHITSEIKKDEFEKINSFNMWKAYAHSKLANILFTRELAKKLEGTGVTANALCPGPVKTVSVQHFNFLVRMIMWPIQKLFFKDVDVGAETYVMCAVEPELEKVTGKYFRECKLKEPSPAAQDDEIAAWLWEQSATMSGL